jgi:LmbE family N-acetylglucosaminyl deacetylase
MLDWLNHSVAIVAAHPDDETIGAGAQLANLRDPMLVQVTDGAPRKLGSARKDYISTRREELAAALRKGGAPSIERFELGAVDQEASLNLAGLTAQLAHLLVERPAEVILTHPYEGGHPDHDATAFAVHAAMRVIMRERGQIPLLMEFTSYHAGPGGMIAGEFLPFEGCRETAVVLTAEARRRKEEMLDCFVSQREMLRHFGLGYERFRLAPPYDFTRPPHPGRLYYERFDWGMTGERWRELARAALCGAAGMA